MILPEPDHGVKVIPMHDLLDLEKEYHEITDISMSNAPYIYYVDNAVYFKDNELEEYIEKDYVKQIAEDNVTYEVIIKNKNTGETVIRELLNGFVLLSKKEDDEGVLYEANGEQVSLDDMEQMVDTFVDGLAEQGYFLFDLYNK
jgi:hypothetical protein